MIVMREVISARNCVVAGKIKAARSVRCPEPPPFPWVTSPRWRQGHKEASLELLAAICDALEVSLSDLLASVSTSRKPVLQHRPTTRLPQMVLPDGALAQRRPVLAPLNVDRRSRAPLRPAFPPDNEGTKRSAAH